MLDKSVNVLDEGMEFLDKCSPLNISVERKCKAKLKEECLPSLSFKNSLKTNINIYQTSDLNKQQLD